MRPVPLRNIIATTAAILCIVLAISNYYAEQIQNDEGAEWMIGAPPPPLGVFPQAALTFPGYLIAIPLLILGSAFEAAWPAAVGMVVGAVFFWYCVGWTIDCARGATDKDNPPKYVLFYFSILRCASSAIFPFALLAGFNVGNHFCANGARPFWSDLLLYGIGMIWITIGASFTWQKFLEKRKTKPISLFA